MNEVIYSILPYPYGCFLFGALPASFVPTIVIILDNASLKLLTASEIIAIEFASNPTNALKPAGALYLSFKYGNFEGERNGRYFTDMTEESMAKLLVDFPEFTVEKQWITGDVRAGRGDERWLNMILRK